MVSPFLVISSSDWILDSRWLLFCKLSWRALDCSCKMDIQNEGSYWQWKTLTYEQQNSLFNATKNTKANQTPKTIPLDGTIPIPKHPHGNISWPRFRWVLLYSQFERQHPFFGQVVKLRDTKFRNSVFPMIKYIYGHYWVLNFVGLGSPQSRYFN